MRKANVVFDNVKRSSVLSEDADVLDAANEVEIGISSICGGKGLCGKCRIIVRKGREILQPVRTIERLSLSEEELSLGYRLACCTAISGEGTFHVEVPPESSVEQQRLQIAGIATMATPDPVVTRRSISVQIPQLENPSADFEALLEAEIKQKISKAIKIDHNALMRLPTAIRGRNGRVTITMYGDDEIIWEEAGEDTNGAHGIAFDIGTTKLAAYLMDLGNGQTVATASLLNPQVQFGDDVITRISYATKDEKRLRQLQGVLVAGLNSLIHDLCEDAHIEATQVCDIAVVGNTAMHHIFLGINPKFLGLSPYSPAVKGGMLVHSRELGLKTNPGAYVYTLPIIAGFVGGDAVADILATEIYKSEHPALLVDVGTNTEVVLSDGHSLVACSCASGPAFEGACIENGMRAETGAIERVYINPENFEAGYATIGGAPPRGICGSGVLDAVAAMLKTGIIDSRGRVTAKVGSPRIRPRNGILEYVLVQKEENINGIDISVTQKDVQEILLAKAAIFAAISVLLRKFKINSKDIHDVFLAGAFGTYVDPQSALLVGMYPEIPLSRIRFVGNSAGSGARMALISKGMRDRARQIAEQTNYVELAGNKTFHEEFMSALFLPHKNSDLFPTTMQMLDRVKYNKANGPSGLSHRG